MKAQEHETAPAFPAELQPLWAALEAAEDNYDELETRRETAEALVKSLTADKAKAEAERSALLTSKLKGSTSHNPDKLAAARAKLREIADELEEAEVALSIFNNDEDGLLLDAANDIRTAHARLVREARAFSLKQYETLKARFPEIVKPLLAELLAWYNVAYNDFCKADYMLNELNINIVDAAEPPLTLPRLRLYLPEPPKAPQGTSAPQGLATSYAYTSNDVKGDELLAKKRRDEMKTLTERDRQDDEFRARAQERVDERKRQDQETLRKMQEANEAAKKKGLKPAFDI